jgi:hypothetical protein
MRMRKGGKNETEKKKSTHLSVTDKWILDEGRR